MAIIKNKCQEDTQSNSIVTPVRTLQAIRFAGSGYFGPGLFRVAGGRVCYEEVHLGDGSTACYLIRYDQVDSGFKMVKRWIAPDVQIDMMYEIEDSAEWFSR